MGHNGQEKSKEVGEDNYTAEFWEYDSQTARRFNLDPKPNPAISDYAAFALNPIWFSDVKGDTTRVFGLDGKYLGTLYTGSVNEAHFIEESIYNDFKNGIGMSFLGVPVVECKTDDLSVETLVRRASTAYLGKNSMADIIRLVDIPENRDEKGGYLEGSFVAYIGKNKEIFFKNHFVEKTSRDDRSTSFNLSDMDELYRKYSNIFGAGHIHHVFQTEMVNDENQVKRT